MNSSLESLDSIYFEFNDLDGSADSTVRPVPDVVLRQLISQQLLNEQALLRQGEDLERILALAREQEQACRQSGDLGGLSRCLGNLALVLKALGDLNGALTLHLEEASICRRLGDTQGLISSLVSRAVLLAEHLNQPEAALALAEEAHQLATQLARGEWIVQTQSALQAIRQRLGGTGLDKETTT
jgi:tetratricopeptide (TPR) repeat protein